MSTAIPAYRHLPNKVTSYSPSTATYDAFAPVFLVHTTLARRSGVRVLRRTHNYIFFLAWNGYYGRAKNLPPYPPSMDCTFRIAPLQPRIFPRRFIQSIFDLVVDNIAALVYT